MSAPSLPASSRASSFAVASGQSIMTFAKTVEGNWGGGPTDSFPAVVIETNFTELRSEDIVAVATMSHVSADTGNARYFAEITDISVEVIGGKKAIRLSYVTFTDGPGNVIIHRITFSGTAFGR